VSAVRTKYALWLIALPFAAAIAWFFFGTGSVPLVSLNPGNFQQFRNAFNGGERAVRAVLLMSPT